MDGGGGSMKTEQVILWAVAIICTTVLSIYSVEAHTQRIKHYVDNDYTRQTIRGSGEPTRVKSTID